MIFSAPVFADNLTAFYEFEEGSGINVLDSSGNSYDGFISPVIPPTWVNGTTNLGLKFYGTGGSNVTLPKGTQWTPDNWTFSADVKLDSLPTPSQDKMFLYSVYQPQYAVYAIIEYYNSTHANIKNEIINNFPYYEMVKGGFVQIDQWYNLKYTYNTDDHALRIYINNSEVTEGLTYYAGGAGNDPDGIFTNGLPDLNENASLGVVTDPNGITVDYFAFNGTMDNVRILNVTEGNITNGTIYPTLAWYRFENNTDDSSGNEFDATFTSVENEFVTGKIDSFAANCSVDGNYLTLPNSSVWTPSNWTFQAWIYPNSIGGVQYIYDERVPNAFMGFRLSGNQLIYDLFSNPSLGRLTFDGITAGTWQHIAGTYNEQTDNQSLYINRTLVASATTYSTGIPFMIHTPTLCSISDSPSNYFNGFIDEVYIKNNINISDDPIPVSDIPVITFESPTPENGFYSSSDSVIINVTATDDVAIDVVILEWNGVNETMTNQGGDVWSTTKSSLAETSHSFVVYANDTSNNVQVTTLRTFVVDVTNPSVSIANPSGTYMSLPIPIDFSASDANLNTSTCFYQLDGGSFIQLVSCDNSSLTTSDGSHSILIIADDYAGNSGNDTSSFDLDSTPPSVTIDSPTGTYNIVADGDPVDLNVTITDATSGINTTSCTYTLDGGSPTALVNCSSTILSSLALGSHTVVVYAEDNVGLNNTDTSNFTVEVTAVVTGANAVLLNLIPIIFVLVFLVGGTVTTFMGVRNMNSEQMMIGAILILIGITVTGILFAQVNLVT